MAELDFSVAAWAAWAPGLRTVSQWTAWAQGTQRPDHAQPPDASAVPAALRRRMSPFARMLFDTTSRVRLEGRSQPIVFASRHGELDRTVALLSTLAHDEPVSPMSFGLSVHNAAVGQFSLVHQDHAESTAIAAVTHGLELAVCEAVAIAHESGGPVLVAAQEGVLPEPYASLVDDVPFAHALALRIEPSGGWRLRHRPTQAPIVESSIFTWLRAVLGTQSTWQTGPWQWERPRD